MISEVNTDYLRSDLLVFGIDLDDDRFVLIGFLGCHLAVADDDNEVAGLAQTGGGAVKLDFPGAGRGLDSVGFETMRHY